MKINMIEANTHTPEYLMHKYWARKPHNVISYFIKELVPKNGYVLDPFMGSGVVINEAIKLGIHSTGIDLNPVAYNISNVLTNPPEIKKFKEVLEPILNELEEICSKTYLTNTGDEIKYAVHSIIVKCPECNNNISADKAIKKGKSNYCPNCNSELHFNLENMIDSKVIELIINKKKKNNQISFFNDKENETKKDSVYSVEELEKQHSESLKNITNVDFNEYDYKVLENKRILAYKGLSTKDFFSTRNFSILCYFADKIYDIQDENIKNTALCLLTGSCAQCSKLIPYRNNLSTGGPAWSVPGFWVPQNHLETNPAIHIRARYEKFLKALASLRNKNDIKPKLINGDSIDILENNKLEEKYDLIFLDPPYGDNIPYTEFSHFWNSFLKKIPEISKDISVSDRLSKNESWNQYIESFNRLFKVLPQYLNENGKLLITYNNNDIRAWKALLNPLQNNNFKCISINYQIPAVISSKASFNPKSSYISDIYSVYKYTINNEISKDISPITNRLIDCASARDGLIYSTLLDREFIISLIENNIDNKILDDKDNIINELFDLYDKKFKIYKLKEQYYRNVPKIGDTITSLVSEEVKLGETNIISIYKKVGSNLSNYGIPELYEFKSYLTDFIISKDKILGKSTN